MFSLIINKNILNIVLFCVNLAILYHLEILLKFRVVFKFLITVITVFSSQILINIQEQLGTVRKA